jgi:hypothetical protein
MDNALHLVRCLALVLAGSLATWLGFVEQAQKEALASIVGAVLLYLWSRYERSRAQATVPPGVAAELEKAKRLLAEQSAKLAALGK